MTTQERQKKAEEQGLIANIGKKIKAVHPYAFRRGDTAEIIGWLLFRSDNDLPVYIVKFKNGECDMIPAGRPLEASGYVFID